MKEIQRCFVRQNSM